MFLKFCFSCRLSVMGVFVSCLFLQILPARNRIDGKPDYREMCSGSYSRAIFIVGSEKYAQAIRECKTVKWEEVTDYPAGEKHGEVSATPFFDFAGRCTNLIGSVYDITERKKVDEALGLSEEKANDLIKYAPSGIYELDYRIPPKFRKVNDAMCQILGYTEGGTSCY